jgi:pimeloyl-ACP methyl ester carboxylesterase
VLVVLVTGERSVDASRPHAERVAAALPDARIVVLDGQDHVADVLDPAAFAAHIVPFLKGDG